MFLQEGVLDFQKKCPLCWPFSGQGCCMNTTFGFTTIEGTNRDEPQSFLWEWVLSWWWMPVYDLEYYCQLLGNLPQIGSRRWSLQRLLHFPCRESFRRFHPELARGWLLRKYLGALSSFGLCTSFLMTNDDVECSSSSSSSWPHRPTFVYTTSPLLWDSPHNHTQKLT